METFCGTTGYASPEMLAGRKYLGVETDIWSMGIILYTLLSGGLPFDDDNEDVMKELILKGEYEEPEWLSEGEISRSGVQTVQSCLSTDARSLIRDMLQPDPIKRPSVEAILTHPWFKRTIVDRMPEQAGDSTQPSSNVNSPNPGATHFEEPWNSPTDSAHPPPRHLSVPSPLHENPPSVPPAIMEESDHSHSEHSLDSEHGKADTGITTPTTGEGSESGSGEVMKRVHSGEFSQTEKDLEMLHSNTSQTTIRRAGSESPNGAAGARNRVAVKTVLEGQTEVDEDALGEEETATGSVSIPHSDDHSLHLPVAQHSRTPSRTKRRSVSSTLSLERRHSHHSTSGQFTSWPPEDFILRLNEVRPQPFSTPSEKHLLDRLSDIGFNTGQIVHSVNNDACDSSAAAWWMLRAKQAERGENDEVILARQHASQRRNERAAAFSREERKRTQRDRGQGLEPSSDVGVGKNANVKFIDTPVIPHTASNVPILEHNAMPIGNPPLTLSPEQLAPVDAATTVPQPTMLHAHSTLSDKPPRSPGPLPESARPFATPPINQRNDSAPATAESSPARGEKDRPTKTRSPSMSMLQRATSVLVPGSWKNEDKDKERVPERAIVDDGDKEDKEKRSISPTKLTKAPPKAKMVKSESDGGISRTLDHGHQPEAGPSSRPMGSAHTSSSLASEGTETASPGSPSKSKTAKRDAFWSWNSFRYMFNDPRRRRSRDDTASPLHKEIKPGPAVVLSRGIGGRGPHVNRVVLPMRRSSIDGRPLYSRRSSSVNSRRSSFNSGAVHESSHDALPSLVLARRTSGRSHGSQTPTSEREYNPLSRPTSLHERDFGQIHHSVRRSSQSLRSPSMQSDHSGRTFRHATPASPLHNYQRRAPKGTDSRRVRHIRVIPEGQIVRSASVASSIRSGASSRASSRDRNTGREDSDYDTGREDGSIHSRRRSDHGSLAQQIHRRNSPLTLPGIGSQRRHSLKPPEPKAPLRDVFQNRDDDWISDDDDDIYSGGLGQKGQQKHVEGKPSWEPNTRATFTPREHEASGPTKKHGRHSNGRRGSSSSRSRKNSSDEEEIKKTRPAAADERPAKVDGEMHTGSQGRRRGIQSGRGTAPVIEEEEEEEE